MLRQTGEWDIRCPNRLAQLFPVRKGYWFKVNRTKAQEICEILAIAYQVESPKVDEVIPKGCNGWYRPGRKTISIWPRAHIKTVFHEFYHHLDHVTKGEYNSSDFPTRRLSKLGQVTPNTSLSWVFADKLFAALSARRGG